MIDYLNEIHAFLLEKNAAAIPMPEDLLRAVRREREELRAKIKGMRGDELIIIRNRIESLTELLDQVEIGRAEYLQAVARTDQSFSSPNAREQDYFERERENFRAFRKNGEGGAKE